MIGRRLRFLRSNHARDLFIICSLTVVIFFLRRSFKAIQDPAYVVRYQMQQDQFQQPISPVLRQEPVSRAESVVVSVQKDDFNRGTYLQEPILADLNEKTLLIFVQSKPINLNWRSMIRFTWGNSSLYDNLLGTDINIKLFFAVGMPQNDSVLDYVKWESSSYRDILLIDMPDEYDNLSKKGFLTMSWILHELPSVNYILKTDDDIVMNTFAWIKIVNQLMEYQLSCRIVCCAWNRPPVPRDQKYAVSFDEYASDTYPSFCSGSGYLMTRDAMQSILEVASNLPFFKRDDPFFTGIVAAQTNVSVMSVDNTSYLIEPQHFPLLKYRAIILMHHPSQIGWSNTWESFLARHEGTEPLRDINISTIRDDVLDLPPDYLLDPNIALHKQCSDQKQLMLRVRT